MLPGLRASPLTKGREPVLPESGRNRIINGAFPTNQRVVSGSVVLAAGAYGHDRWKAGAAGCSYTFAASGNDTIITISAGSLIQVIEGANVEGGSYAMSWFGTSTGKIGAGSAGASGVTGAATSGANLSVEFGTGTLTRVQLEPGVVATPFERRPVGLELFLCQRYYSKSYQYAVAPGTNTGLTGGIEDSPGQGVTFTLLVHRARFPVPARTDAPTVTIYDSIGNANVITLFNPALNNGQGVAALDSISAHGFRVVSQSTSPQRICFHWTMSAEL